MYSTTDINECEEFNGNCEHNCTNTNGSYDCSCDEGYVLNEDGYNCTKSSLPEKPSDFPMILTICVIIAILIIMIVILLATGNRILPGDRILEG